MGLPPDWLDRFAAAGMHPTGESGMSPPPAPLTEKEFQADVMRLAKAEGWKAFHVFNSRRSESGFPDCVFLRDRLIVAELKTEDGRPTAAQLNWLDAFRAAGVPAFLWRPSDMAAIVQTLRR